jgi:hypothetical protein
MRVLCRFSAFVSHLSAAASAAAFRMMNHAGYGLHGGGHAAGGVLID